MLTNSSASTVSELYSTVASRPPTSPRRIACPSLTGPAWVRSGFVSLAAMSRWRRLSRRVTTMPIIEAMVSTPMPPICAPIRMTALPNGDQCVDMSTTVRPVTHTVLVAVNSADGRSVQRPVALAQGVASTSVVSAMIVVNARIANREGEWPANVSACSLSTRSAVRATPESASAAMRAPAPESPPPAASAGRLPSVSRPRGACGRAGRSRATGRRRPR